MFAALTNLTGIFALAVSFKVLTGGSGYAKPLLTNSQSTYVSACLDQQDTSERLIEICQNGLGEAGASDRQRVEMLDVLAWAHFDLDDLDQAEAAFDEILTLSPNAEPGLQGLGWMRYYRDDYAAAVEFFRQAVSRKPTAQNLAGLAASQYSGGQIGFDAFEGQIRTALALEPDYSWAIRELAWVQVDEGLHDDALASFRSAAEVDPNDPYAEYGVAYVLTERDEWDSAFDHVTRALDLYPDFISAKSRRSLILLMLDRPKQALKDAEAVIAAKPDDADGYVRKARALSVLGRRSEAHSVLANAENRAGPSSYLLYWRASLLADDLDYAPALTQIRRSVEREDADHFDHRLHAEIALWLDRKEEARGAINRALKLNPEGSYIQFTNALVLLGEGKFDTAEKTFDAAIQAGLSEDNLSEFLSSLVAEGRFVQAIRMRVRYSTRATEAGGELAGSN